MDLLSELRRQHCLSIEAMAARLKIRSQTLRRLESGEFDLPEIRPQLEHRLKMLGWWNKSAPALNS